jgi:anti-anti-sigma regulatory factor
MEGRALVVDCAALREPDAELVEALAHLQLDLRRRRCELRLVNVGPRLLELIEFAGLARVLGVEPRGEAEEGEDAGGVEEERDLGDAPV